MRKILYKYKKFTKEEKKSIEQQVYIGDEKQQIIELALEQYKKTKNTAYLGVCLNFILDSYGERMHDHAIIGDLKCNHKSIKSVTNCNQKNQALKKAGSL